MAKASPSSWGPNSHLYSTCSRWGLALGVTQILALVLGDNINLSIFRNQHIGVPNASVSRRSGI